MRFEFATATRIIFSAGAISQAAPLARESGRKALITTGRDTTRAQRLFNDLRQLEIQFIPFAIEGEPDIEIIQRGVALGRREKCDMVIAYGGGSALDAGKSIATLMTNDGDVFDYLEVVGKGKTLAASPAPFIAIPTTSGTGSEVTRNAVLALPDRRGKVSLRSPLMLPKAAVVDPELTWDLPPAVTARTGMDALTQLIEPFTTPRANPMTDGLCVEGIKRVARSLRTAFKNGRDAGAREDLALASLFGGLALSNAGLGAVHGLAGIIGGKFAAPHGAICGILLPQAMAANLAALRARDAAHPALARYDEIARLVTGRSAAQADDGVEWVRELAFDLQIPRLGIYGQTPEHTREVIDKSRAASSMKANPIVLTDGELAALLDGAL